MHQIGDDLFWLPADFKPKKDYTIEDVLTGFEEVKPNGKEIKKFSQILQEFQGSQKFTIIEPNCSVRHIEDEVLEQLGITEDDLLLESALQASTFDHKQYIDELIKECLTETPLTRRNMSFSAEVSDANESTGIFYQQYQTEHLQFEQAIAMNQLSKTSFVFEQEYVQKPSVKPKYRSVIDYIAEQECTQEENSQLTRQESALAYTQTNRMDQFYFGKVEQLQNELFLKYEASKPRCLAYLQKRDIYAVGTSNGVAFLYDRRAQNVQQFSEASQKASISHLSFSPDGQHLLVSYVSGTVSIYNIQTQQPKLVKILNQLHSSVVLHSAFVGQLQFLTCSNKGFVTLSKIFSSTFSWSASNQILIEKPGQPIYQLIPVLGYVALVSKNDLLIGKITGGKEDQISHVFKRKFEGNGRLWATALEGYLACGIDCQIEVLSICQKGGQFFCEVAHSITLASGSLIDSVHYLSENVIFAKVEKRKFVLVDPFEKSVILQDYFYLDVADQNYLSVILGTYPASFANTIVTSNNRIVLLESCGDQNRMQFLLSAQLIPWFEYATKKIENMEWIESLAMLVAMYEGTARLFAQIPPSQQRRQVEMRPFLNDTILKFVSNNFDSMSETKLMTVIDFLTKCESYTFLFDTILGKMKKQGFGPLFLDCLEAFITKKKIKEIPKETLSEVMQNLKDQNKCSVCIIQYVHKIPKLMRQMILNLDYRRIDCNTLVQACSEFQLMTPLAFICPRVDDDYLMPLVKFFSYYKQQLESSDSLTKDVQYHGYRCLWYLGLCFEGVLLPDERIPEQSWPQALSTLLVLINLTYWFKEWVISSGALSYFFSLNLSQTLTQMLILFNAKQSSFVAERWFTMLMEAIENTKCSNPDRELVIGLFLGEVVMLGHTLDTDRLMSAITAALENPHLSLEKYNQIQSDLYLNQKSQEFTDDIIFYNKQKMLVDLLRRNETLDLERLERLTDSSILQKIIIQLYASTEVKAQIKLLQGNYKRVVEIFFMAREKPLKKKVFEYIDLCIYKLQEPKFRIELQRFLAHLLDSLKELVLIDAELTGYLLERYEEKEQQEVITKLNEFPQLKFKLLNKMIAKKRAGKEHIEGTILFHYFELICLLYPEQAIEELKIGDFPQDECLNICKKYKIQKAVAYLLERSGSVQEAINLQFDIFISNLKGLLQKEGNLLYEKDINKKLVEFIETNLDPCLSICRINTKRNDDESDQNWFLFMVRITKLRQEFYHMKNSKGLGLLKSFNFIYTNILQEILTKIQLKSLLQNLDQTMKFFSLAEMKNTFAHLLSGQFYEHSILDQSMTLIKEECILDYYRLYEAKVIVQKFFDQQKGLSVLNGCCLCLQFPLEDLFNIEVFQECSHVFHDTCLHNKQVEPPFCFECSKISSLLIRKSLRIQTLARKFKKKQGDQEEKKTEDQAKIERKNRRRLIKFEKLRKFDSREKSVAWI